LAGNAYAVAFQATAVQHVSQALPIVSHLSYIPTLLLFQLPLDGSITIPEAQLTAINTTTISYIVNETPSAGTYNSSGSTQLPLVVDRPGFSATRMTNCTNSSQVSGRVCV
jgi:hypothetical protein